MGDNKRWETLVAGKQQKKQLYYLKRQGVVAKATRRLKTHNNDNKHQYLCSKTFPYIFLFTKYKIKNICSNKTMIISNIHK